MARKFLYVIAALIVLSLASSLAYRLWGQQMLSAVMVPRARFAEPTPLTAQDYARPDLWLARPDQPKGNPALWLPAGHPTDSPPARPAAIFFIHPTSYMADANRARWNAMLDDRGALNGAVQFLRGQASAFSSAGAVWAPKYRQAHFGAFLTDKPEAGKALDAAYRDVAAAFSAFLAANPDGPIILAGHSQGSRHLMRLMHERVARNPALAARIAAVYIVGWPVSVEADVPALGLPACTRRGEARCILSWQSFAEPAETGSVLHAFEKDAGYTGKPRRGSQMLCVNPLTGMPDSAAAARLNLGTLVLTDPPAASTLVPAAVPARCDARGFLLIGDAPSVGSYVLPGNNFHVYDYSLFWANVRHDVAERLTTFTGS